MIRFGLIYSRLHEEVPIARFGPAVEEMGFDAIWVTEGLVNELPALDALAALQAFADHTRTIRVGTCVVLLPLRHPVMLAKQVASIDALSGGRVTLGVGVGGSRNSGRAAFEALGIPVAERGPRADEALEVLLKLWQGGPASHDGRFYSFTDIAVEPRPQQRPHPPIWVGGGCSAPVLRRVARWGDGWVPTDLTPSEYAEGWERIAAQAEEHGRDAADLTPAVHLYLSMDDDTRRAHRAAERTLSERYGFRATVPDDGRHAFGSAQACREAIEHYAQVGVRDFVINVARPLPEVFGQMERLRTDVMADLSAGVAKHDQEVR